MPGKYSHGVVLANYSSRGVISLPNDKQLNYLKSVGPSPAAPTIYQISPATSERDTSAPPSENHLSVVRSTSIKTSNSAKSRASTVFENKATSRQSRQDQPAKRYEFLGESHRGVTPAPKERKVIIDSDDESTEDGVSTQKNQSRVSVAHVKLPTKARSSPPADPACDFSNSLLQSQLPGGVRTSRAIAGHEIVGPGRKHVNGLAAQKYEPKGALHSGTPLHKRHPLTRSLSEVSSSGNSSEQLLSVHEFLEGAVRSMHQAQAGTESYQKTNIKEASKSEANARSLPPNIAELPSELSTPPLQSEPRRGHTSSNHTSDDRGPGHRQNGDLSGRSTNTFSGPTPSQESNTHSETILDLIDERPQRSKKPPTAAFAHGTRDKRDSQHRPAAQQRKPVKEPDSDSTIDSGDGSALPTQVLSPPASSRARHPNNDTAAPTLNPASVTSHNGYSASVDTTDAEPDFSNFSDSEEIGDPTEKALTAISIHGRDHRAVNKDTSPREFRPISSPLASPTPTHRNDRRPLWLSDRSRTTSKGSDAQTLQHQAASNNVQTNGPGPEMVIQQASKAHHPQQSERDVLKLKSEQKMRMKLPTPTTSLTESRKDKTVISAHPKSPPARPVRQNSDWGIPSIVRSPPKEKQHTGTASMTSLPQKRSATSRGKDVGPVSPQKNDRLLRRSRTGSYATQPGNPTYDSPTIDNKDEEIGRWTVPTTIGPCGHSLKNQGPKPVKADFEVESRPGSVTPRPQTAIMAPKAQSRQFAAAAGPSLVTALDDISSLPSAGLANDHQINSPITPTRTHSQLDALFANGQEDQDDQDSDIALPPPDISRYPPPSRSMERPRSQKGDTSRLSSLTALRQKLNRKSKEPLRSHLPADGVRTLNVAPRNGHDLKLAQARANVKGVDARLGPGKATGIDRLEAMLSQAEEEAKANTGMRGVWGRMKRRIES